MWAILVLLFYCNDCCLLGMLKEHDWKVELIGKLKDMAVKHFTSSSSTSCEPIKATAYHSMLSYPIDGVPLLEKNANVFCGGKMANVYPDPVVLFPGLNPNRNSSLFRQIIGLVPLFNEEIKKRGGIHMADAIYFCGPRGELIMYPGRPRSYQPLDYDCSKRSQVLDSEKLMPHSIYSEHLMAKFTTKTTQMDCIAYQHKIYVEGVYYGNIIANVELPPLAFPTSEIEKYITEHNNKNYYNLSNFSTNPKPKDVTCPNEVKFNNEIDPNNPDLIDKIRGGECKEKSTKLWEIYIVLCVVNVVGFVILWNVKMCCKKPENHNDRGTMPLAYFQFEMYLDYDSDDGMINMEGVGRYLEGGDKILYQNLGGHIEEIDLSLVRNIFGGQEKIDKKKLIFYLCREGASQWRAEYQFKYFEMNYKNLINKWSKDQLINDMVSVNELLSLYRRNISKVSAFKIFPMKIKSKTDNSNSVVIDFRKIVSQDNIYWIFYFWILVDSLIYRIEFSQSRYANYFNHSVYFSRVSGDMLKYTFYLQVLLMSLKKIYTPNSPQWLSNGKIFGSLIEIYLQCHLKWHRMTGILFVIFGIIHSTFHLYNFTIASNLPMLALLETINVKPSLVKKSGLVEKLDIWGTKALWSGIALAVITILLAITSHPNYIKSHYEIFKIFHYVAIVLLFALMILHGQDSLLRTPTFQSYFYLLVPYINGLIWTWIRCQKMKVTSLEILNSKTIKVEMAWTRSKKPLLELLDKTIQFSQGQYVEILIANKNNNTEDGNYYKKLISHSFTICSFDDSSLTLVIKNAEDDQSLASPRGEPGSVRYGKKSPKNITKVHPVKSSSSKELIFEPGSTFSDCIPKEEYQSIAGSSESPIRETGRDQTEDIRVNIIDEENQASHYQSLSNHEQKMEEINEEDSQIQKGQEGGRGEYISNSSQEHASTSPIKPDQKMEGDHLFVFSYMHARSNPNELKEFPSSSSTIMPDEKTKEEETNEDKKTKEEETKEDKKTNEEETNEDEKTKDDETNEDETKEEEIIPNKSPKKFKRFTEYITDKNGHFKKFKQELFFYVFPPQPSIAMRAKYHSQVILIAGGGVSITPFTSIILGDKKSFSHLQLVWSLKTISELKQFSTFIGKLDQPGIKIDLFITSMFKNMNSCESSIYKSLLKIYKMEHGIDLAMGENLNITYSRPDFDKIFLDVKAPDSVYPLAVFVCGRAILKSVRKSARESRRDIIVYNEPQ